VKYFRKSEDRGSANFGWLTSKHSFSFGTYYDPHHMGVSALRVINDDTVAPSRGFDMHSHQNMEIVSYILEGEIEHRDSTGNLYRISAGEVQRMSAGTGITHAEYNVSDREPLKFLQIWIQPNQMNIAPDYEQKRIEQTSPLTLLVSPEGEHNSLRIHQQARISRLRLNKSEAQLLPSSGEHAYLHVTRGSATISIDSATPLLISAGDGLGGKLEHHSEVAITANEDGFEALWFELP